MENSISMNSSQVAKILDEIKNSEIDYLRNLDIAINFIKVPLQIYLDEISDSKQIKSPSLTKLGSLSNIPQILFSNLERMKELSEKFLEILLKDAPLGKCFSIFQLNIMKFFDYELHIEMACNKVEELRKEPNLEGFFRACELLISPYMVRYVRENPTDINFPQSQKGAPIDSKHKIEKYLKMPAQRFLRYSIILNFYLDHVLDDTSEDYSVVQDVLDLVLSLISQVKEENLRRKSVDPETGMKRIEKVQKAFSGLPKDFLQPSRYYIHDADLSRVTQNKVETGRTVLCNDLIIYGSEKHYNLSSKVLKYCGQINLKNAMLVDFEAMNHQFVVYSVTSTGIVETTTFLAPSLKVKKEWISLISDALHRLHPDIKSEPFDWNYYSFRDAFYQADKTIIIKKFVAPEKFKWKTGMIGTVKIYDTAPLKHGSASTEYTGTYDGLHADNTVFSSLDDLVGSGTGGASWSSKGKEKKKYERVTLLMSFDDIIRAVALQNEPARDPFTVRVVGMRCSDDGLRNPAESGLRLGDCIKSVNVTPVTKVEDIIDVIRSSAYKSELVPITVSRKVTAESASVQSTSFSTSSTSSRQRIPWTGPTAKPAAENRLAVIDTSTAEYQHELRCQRRAVLTELGLRSPPADALPHNQYQPTNKPQPMPHERMNHARVPSNLGSVSASITASSSGIGGDSSHKKTNSTASNSGQGARPLSHRKLRSNPEELYTAAYMESSADAAYLVALASQKAKQASALRASDMLLARRAQEELDMTGVPDEYPRIGYKKYYHQPLRVGGGSDDTDTRSSYANDLSTSTGLPYKNNLNSSGYSIGGSNGEKFDHSSASNPRASEDTRWNQRSK